MKKIIVIIISFISFLAAQAQKNEIGIILGTTYYLGDLNPSKQFFLSKPAGGIIYRYVINQRWAIKMDGIYGSVAGDDAKAKFNVERNLSFKSPLIEFSSQLELNFLPYQIGNDKAKFTPYIFAGIAVFSFKPEAEYEGKWYNLQPLGTEGQGTSASSLKPYSLTKISFPFGIGFKYSLGKNVGIGVEWGIRKTTTDYLDDVSTTYADPVILSAEHGSIAAILADRSLNDSQNTNVGKQRGNSNTKDWYSFAGAYIVFKMNAKSKSCPAYSKHHYKKFNEFLIRD